MVAFGLDISHVCIMGNHGQAIAVVLF